MTRAGQAAAAALMAALMAAFVGTGAAPAAADTSFDGSLSYAARDELKDSDDNKYDNDLLRAMGAVTWGAGDGRIRAALEFGVGNDDFSGDYPWMIGTEVVFARRIGDKRFGIGARVRSAEHLSTTGEVGYALQHLGTRFDLRGLVGVQFVGNASDVPGRTGASLFGLGEASFYATPNLALSAAIQGDSDGAVYGVGAEYRAPGWGGFSLFADYAEAFDDYRDQPTYDMLAAGIRYVPGYGTLREKRQSNLGQLMRRYVEVQ